MNPRQQVFLAATLLALCSDAAAGPLEEAYAREAETLKAESTALRSALEERKAQLDEATSAVSKDIERLSGELIALRASNESIEAGLPARERSFAAEDSERELREVVERASLWLKVEGAPVFDFDELSAPRALPRVFEAAFARVDENGGYRVDEVEVFDQSGAARTDQVVLVGEVGAVLHSTLGALAPVEKNGFRELKVSDTPMRSGAVAVAPVLLIDPRAESTWHVERTRGVLTYLLDGGMIMWPLAALGLLVIALAIERSLALLNQQRNWNILSRELGEISTHHAWDRQLSKTADTAPWLAAPFNFVLEHRDRERAALEERIEELFSRMRPRFIRGLALLGVVAAAAPLLGLLGTVTGMIGTFEVITHEGTGDPRLLSDGISQALLTTQLGLSIAIPSLLLHTLFNRWARRLHARIATSCAELIHHIEDAKLTTRSHEHP